MKETIKINTKHKNLMFVNTLQIIQIIPSFEEVNSNGPKICMVQIVCPKIQKPGFYDFEMKFWYQFDKLRRKIQNPYVRKGRKVQN